MIILILLTPCRTKLFYFLAMTDALSEITAPPLEAFTMAISLWLSFALATLIFIIVFFLIWTLPETKPTYPGFTAANSASEGPQSLPALNMEVSDINSRRISCDNSSMSQPLLTSSGDTNSPYGTTEHKFMQVPEYGSNPWKEMLALLRTPSLLIVLLCLLAKRVGFTSEIFFAQYASERFHLILRQTPWFEWAKAIGSFLALGFALPLITSYLGYWNFSARRIDLGIVGGNLMILAAGFFVMGTASVPLLYGAGTFALNRLNPHVTNVIYSTFLLRLWKRRRTGFRGLGIVIRRAGPERKALHHDSYIGYQRAHCKRAFNGKGIGIGKEC